MRRFCLGVAGLLLSGGAVADGLPAAAVADGTAGGCAQAYSFGEVVSPDDRRDGPIIALPDTLCPDLAGGQGTRIESIYINVRREGTVQHPILRVPRPYKAPRPQS